MSKKIRAIKNQDIVKRLLSTQHHIWANKIQKPHPSNRESDCGFTLIEIMVAIFIFSIVVTIAFTSYNSVLTKTDILNEVTSVNEMAKNCLNRMILDLQAIQVPLLEMDSPSDFDAPPGPYRITGENINAGPKSFPRLRFTSLAHVPFEKSRQDGIAEIVYYVQVLGSNNYILKRSDSLYPYLPFEEKGTDPILCEGLKSLEFKYIDPDGTEHDRWDSDSADLNYEIPKAIEIRLELGDDSASFAFKTMVTLPVCKEQPKTDE